MNFQIGDRIKTIESAEHVYEEGLTGEIIDIAGIEIGIKFDTPQDHYHTLNGKVPNYTGYWVYREHIALNADLNTWFHITGVTKENRSEVEAVLNNAHIISNRCRTGGGGKYFIFDPVNLEYVTYYSKKELEGYFTYYFLMSVEDLLRKYDTSSYQQQAAELSLQSCKPEEKEDTPGIVKGNTLKGKVLVLESDHLIIKGNLKHGKVHRHSEEI